MTFLDLMSHVRTADSFWALNRPLHKTEAILAILALSPEQFDAFDRARIERGLELAERYVSEAA